MATQDQERKFAKEMAPPEDTTALDKAIFWINQNLSPSEVFDDSILRYWAVHHGYVEDEEDA